MNETFALELNLSAISPVIVTNNLPIGNSYMSLQYIPASMLKGAILTELRKKFCNVPNINNCDECNNDTCFFKAKVLDKLIVKPGIPIVEKCKSHKIFNITPRTIERCKNCGELVDSTLLYTKEGKMKDRCPKCEYKPFAKQFGPYCSDCNKPIEVNKVFKTNIAIDRELMSTMEGMLFYYEAIQQHTTFKALLFGEGNELKTEVKNLERIHVGRGKSRGYGVIVIKSEVQNWDNVISDIISKIKKSIDEAKRVILIGLTPFASLKWSSDGLKSIPRIDELNLNGKKVNLEKAIGSTEFVSGWALHTNTQKPRFKAGAPGSVFIYKADNMDQNSIEDLAVKELKGVGDEILRQNGFNIFTIWGV
ncbi:MAG: hypothetical protein HWN67_02375 [Candidatus Helarchaeota archaeon]|nr:hypothetical protein [Candidatus Helarchaeota archaeon]